MSKAAEYCTVQLDQAVGGTLDGKYLYTVKVGSTSYVATRYQYNRVQTLTLVLGILFAPLRVTHTTGNVVTHGWS